MMRLIYFISVAVILNGCSSLSLHETKPLPIDGRWACGWHHDAGKNAFGIMDLRSNYTINLKKKTIALDAFSIYRSKDNPAEKISIRTRVNSKIITHGNRVDVYPFYTNIENFNDGNSISAEKQFIDSLRVVATKNGSFVFDLIDDRHLAIYGGGTAHCVKR